MRCRKVKKKMFAFLDGEVREKEGIKISYHLENCNSCKKEKETLLSLNSLLKKGKETIEPSPYFLNQLEQRIALLEKEENLFGKLLERINRAFIPATATAVIIIGLFLGNHFGKILYSRIAGILSPKENSLAQEVVGQSLHLNSLDDFPSESLGGIYIALITESNKTPEVTR